MQRNIKHFASPSFWKCYKRLPKDIQNLARKSFDLLKEDPTHPSLHIQSMIRCCPNREVSPQNSSKYEQGISVPSALVLKRMAQALGVTTDILLNQNGYESRVVKVSDVEPLRKIEQVDLMDEQDKRAIERVIDLALFQYSVKKNLQAT